MKITAITADLWKMDGGVGFGVVPKILWTKVYPEDENNLVLIFQHDYYCEACSLQQSEKGIITGKDFKIHETN